MTKRVELPEGQDTFKLNEVCKLANVQPYMLRFWGTEFPQLEAAKSGTGQRLYSRDQVELILEIRRLLFDEGLTIAGARKKVAQIEAEGGPKKMAKAKKGKANAKAEADAEKETAADEPEAEEAAAEVDKTPPADVQPLVAALEHVREEVSKIVAELRSES